MILLVQPVGQCKFFLTGETPGIGWKIKQTVVLALLNIVLSTVDVGSDVALFVKFYSYAPPPMHPLCTLRKREVWRRCYEEGPYASSTIYSPEPHYGWGTLMFLPFLLNYLICWYVWATTDKRKTVTWVAALLSFYPQFVACEIIWLIWTNPKKSLHQKRHLERNLSQIETFVEAVPSTLVMTFLLIRKYSGELGGEIIFDHTNVKDTILFWLAFWTSIITSSLGLAKNLKVGACRILPEQKRCLGGLLSPRFILIFFACGLTFFAKALTLLGVVEIFEDNSAPRLELSLKGCATTLCTIFLPGFLTSLFACWHKGILKTFLAHPSVFLLPVFSFFTFASNSKKWCRSARLEADTFITFSPKYTAINAGVNIAGLLIYVFIIADSLFYDAEDYTIQVIPFILGLLLTLATTFSNQCNCCRNCCCSSCCTEPFEIGALLTSSPHTPYVLGSDGQLRKEGTSGGLEEEMESMVKEVEVRVESPVEDVEAGKMVDTSI